MDIKTGSILTYEYTGDIKTVTLPPGKYQLEVWGARGGYGQSTTYRGGYGGYSTGILTIEKNDTTLYIVCGGKGVDATSTGSEKRAGGYNGGGNTYGTGSKYTGSGGGATHIALQTGILSALSSAKDKVLLVAGGGGGGGYESSSFTSTGGHGGGTSGGNGTTTNSSYTTGKGGSQTAGGAGYQGAGSFGQGGHATADAVGGGGGYYGGGSGQYTCGGGGGSGYVNTAMLTETSTIAGSANMPKTNGSGTMTGNNAAGYAKITAIEVFSLYDPIKGFIKLNNQYNTLKGLRCKTPYAWEEVLAFYVKENGVWRLLEPASETSSGDLEPFNQALELVGLDTVGSVEELLSNSDYCTTLSRSTEACAIMKNYYSSNIVEAINTNWNEGLNTLSYQCNLKCYLFKDGNECNDITGGWAHQEFNINDQYAMNTGSAIRVKRECASLTRNKLPLHRYKTITFDAYYDYSWMSDDETEWFRLFADTVGTERHWGYYSTTTPTQLYNKTNSEKDIARKLYTANISTSVNVAVIVQAYTDAGLYVYSICLEP